jgi:alkaline phosphatase
VDGRGVDCPTSLNSKLDSILKWAKRAGKSTGIVTTTRLTHATPSSAYASIWDREMEAFDGKNFRQEHRDQGCKDIAEQFIEHAASVNVSNKFYKKIFKLIKNPPKKKFVFNLKPKT